MSQGVASQKCLSRSDTGCHSGRIHDPKETSQQRGVCACPVFGRRSTSARRLPGTPLTFAVIRPDNMIYLVVGDAATQAAGLRELGLGEPILLDNKGNRIN